MNPQSQLYTRAQIAALTGVDPSSLNYWSREGLLIPSEGGAGKGSHRRFDWVQVNIAAVLGELRGFRLNISSLRSLADLLQSAARLGADRELHPGNYPYAARLASALASYREGLPFMLPLHHPLEERPANLRGRDIADWISAKRPAASEQEITSEILNHCDEDPKEAIAAVAGRLGPGKEYLAEMHGHLVYDVLVPGYAGSYSWLLALNPDDSWRVAFGEDGSFFGNIYGEKAEDFGAAIFVPVSGVIRRMWDLKSPEVFRRERDAARIKARLAAAGIAAEVSLGETEDDDFHISAPEADMAAIAAVLGDAFVPSPSENAS